MSVVPDPGSPQNIASDSLISPGQPNQPALNHNLKQGLYAIIISSIVIHIIWFIILILCVSGVLTFLDDKTKVDPDSEHRVKIVSTLLTVFLFVDTILSILYDVCGLFTLSSENYKHMQLYRGCAFLVMLISFALLASTGLWIYLVTGLFYLTIVGLMSWFIYPLYLSNRNPIGVGNQNQYGTSNDA